MRWLCMASLVIACGGGGKPEPEPPFDEFTDQDDGAAGDADGQALSTGACEPQVPPWSISVETCAERAETLRKLYAGTSWDEPVVRPGFELPVAADWKKLPGDAGTVRGPVIALPAAGEDPAPPSPRLEEARAAAEPYVLVLASAEVPMVELADLAASLPGKALRLAVRKPASALLAPHLARYPWTPDWVRQLVTGCAALTLDTLGPALEQAAKGCEGAARVLEQLGSGAGIDVVGPLAAAALLNCECSARDADGFVSLLIFATSPMPDVGWVPLPTPVPRTGRVGDWVASR